MPRMYWTASFVSRRQFTIEISYIVVNTCQINSNNSLENNSNNLSTITMKQQLCLPSLNQHFQQFHSWTAKSFQHRVLPTVSWNWHEVELDQLRIQNTWRNQQVLSCSAGGNFCDREQRFCPHDTCRRRKLRICPNVCDTLGRVVLLNQSPQWGLRLFEVLR